jgi:hypothetical protein
MEVFKATINRTDTALKIPPIPPPTLDPRAIDHFHAAFWYINLTRVQMMNDKDAEHVMTHQEFYAEYQHYCSSHSLNPILMHELLRLSFRFHPDSISQDPPHVLGLRPKVELKEQVEEEEEEGLVCKITEKKFENLESFSNHILSYKVKGVACPWKGCGRSFESEKQVQHHLKVHIPTTFPSKPDTPKRPQNSEVHDDLKGIPLCALLVIRNIAKHPQNHQYFSPFEKDLATMLTNAKFNRTVASVLAELK